jgi:hypothetical protein
METSRNGPSTKIFVIVSWKKSAELPENVSHIINNKSLNSLPYSKAKYSLKFHYKKAVNEKLVNNLMLRPLSASWKQVTELLRGFFSINWYQLPSRENNAHFDKE